MQAIWILIGTVYALQLDETAAAENSTLAEVVEFRNVTVFINYADNVFGISKTVSKRGNNAKGYEVVFLKGYPLKPPDPRDVKFQLAKESSAEGDDVTRIRSKRGVLHLYNMISCATGCNPFHYKGYGCYCGFLGSGRSVDGIDRCCKIHDDCYEISGCQLFLQYIVPYFWKCYYNRPLCAIDHVEFGGPESCASRLCQCDKRLSECLSRFPCPKRRPVCFSSPLRAAQNVLMTIVD